MNRRITYRDYENVIHMMPDYPPAQAHRRTRRSSGPGALMALFVGMALGGAALATFASLAA
jgi:hypothetical protein